MGIRGLNGWVKWAAPKTVKKPDWSELSGKTIGIDVLAMLYKVKARNGCALAYMAQFISACKQRDIRPIFIFDGRPPDAKRAALKARNDVRQASVESLKYLEANVAPFVETEVEKALLESRIRSLQLTTCFFTSEERDLCKQLCYAAGVQSLNATGEADDVLAHLYKDGTIQAVISCDMDMLARGVQTLLVPSLLSIPGDEDGWEQYNLQSILTAVNLTYDQFVEMCVLMGSDYNVGERLLPYRSAYWAIKYRGDLLKTLEVLEVFDETPYYDAVNRLKGLSETQETLMGEKQWEKLRAGPPRCEPEFLALLRDGPLKTLSVDSYNALC